MGTPGGQVVEEARSSVSGSGPLSIPTELGAPTESEVRDLQSDLDREPPLQLPTELGTPSQAAIQTERAALQAEPAFQVPTQLERPSETPVDRARAALEGEDPADVPTELGEPGQRKVDEARVRISTGVPILVPTVLSTDSWEVRYEKAREMIENLPAVEVPTEAEDPITEAWRARVKAELKGISADAVNLPVNPEMAEYREQVLIAIGEIESAVHQDIPVQMAAGDRFKTEVLALAEEVRAEVQAQIPVEPVLDQDAVKKTGSATGSALASAIGLAVIAGGPLIGGALIAGTSIGLTALGAYLEKGNTQIQAGWQSLSQDAKSAATDAATSMVPPIQGALTRIDDLVVGEQPRLSSMFEHAAQDVKPLTDGLVGLAQTTLPALDNALARSQPIAQGLADVERSIGNAIADVANQTASSSGAIGSDLSEVGQIVGTVGHGIGDLVGITANLAQGALPALDGVLHTVVGTLDDAESVLGPIGPEVGAMAAAAAIGVPVFRALQTATEGWAVSLESSALLGGANRLIESTTGITGGLGGLARGLPYVGIAVAGLSALTGVLSDQQDKAAAATQKQASSSDDLDTALRGVEDATTTQINSAVLQHTQTVLNTAATGDQIFTHVQLANVLAASGISQATFASAVEQGGTALDSVKGRLQDYIAGVQQQYNATGNSTDAQQANSQAADVLANHLGGLRNAFLGSAAAQQIQTAIWEQQTGFLPGLSGQIEQIGADTKVLGDDSSTASAKLQALLDQMHQMAEGGAETADDAIEGAAKAVQDLSTQLSGTKGPLFNAQGGLDLWSQKGQVARDAIKQVVDQIGTYASALANQGDTQQQVTSKTQDLVNELVGPLAKSLGISRQHALDLIEAYGGIPSQVATAITTPGATLAFQNIGQVQRSLENLPPNTPVTVTGLTAAAEARLKTLGFDVTHLPNGTVTVTAHDAVTSAVNQIIRTNSGKTIRVNVSTGQIHAGPGSGFAHGGLIQPNAVGNVDVPAQGLTPMSGSVATVVPPDTWRVIGDNMTKPELFAPLDGSQRSRSLIAAAAANQGVSTGTTKTTSVEIHNHISVRDNDSAYELAHRVSAQTQWDLMTSVGG
jgi:hypothetical protein